VRLPERFEIEALFGASSAGGAQPASELRPGNETFECGGELVRVAWTDEQTGLAVEHGLRHPAHPGGDHRQSGRHRFQHRHRKPFGFAGKDEDVCTSEQLRNVAALARQLHARRQAQPFDLLLQLSTVGPLAHDQRVERPRWEDAEGADQGDEVLRRFEAADGDDHRRRPVMLRLRCGGDVDCVRDHHGSLSHAGVGLEPGCLLALRDADRRRRERPDQTVGPAVEPRGETRVRQERPAVHGEQANRNADETGGQPGEHSGLGAARMDDVGSFTAQQAHQLDQAEEIANRTDWAADMFEREVAGFRRDRSLAEGAHSVRGDDDVEPLGQRGEQRRDVCLSSADLGERDHQDDPRTPRA
jgi:hypothetical protein